MCTSLKEWAWYFVICCVERGLSFLPEQCSLPGLLRTGAPALSPAMMPDEGATQESLVSSREWFWQKLLQGWMFK
eukprot:2460660-Amphidinium_carterae.1